MAQTTGQVTGATGSVFIKVSGGAYTDISGSSNSIDAPTATRTTGEAYTLDGDIALTTVGKREPVEVTVNIVYTEVAGEAWLTAEAAFVANNTVQIKWLPKGSASGADQYETAADGRITSIDYAPIDGSSAGPVLCKFTVRSSGITYTANT